jgi:hypothetical protein
MHSLHVNEKVENAYDLRTGGRNFLEYFSIANTKNQIFTISNILFILKIMNLRHKSQCHLNADDRYQIEREEHRNRNNQCSCESHL